MKYDIDVGVTVGGTITAGGTITEAYQLKSLESNSKIIRDIDRAAGQLINAPGTLKRVEVRVFGGQSGTYTDFVNRGKEARLINNILPNYPGVEVQIEFSGGTVKTYKYP